MQTATSVINNQSQLNVLNTFSERQSKPSLLSRMFGCRHKEMSRPFSANGQTYRSCVDCGARRQFDIERWEMQGGYYYGSPSSKRTANAIGLKTRPFQLVTQ